MMHTIFALTELGSDVGGPMKSIDITLSLGCREKNMYNNKMAEQSQNFVYSAFKPNSMGASTFPVRNQNARCKEDQARPAPVVPCYQPVAQAASHNAIQTALYGGSGSGGINWTMIAIIAAAILLLIFLFVMWRKHQSSNSQSAYMIPQN